MEKLIEQFQKAYQRLMELVNENNTLQQTLQNKLTNCEKLREKVEADNIDLGKREHSLGIREAAVAKVENILAREKQVEARTKELDAKESAFNDAKSKAEAKIRDEAAKNHQAYEANTIEAKRLKDKAATLESDIKQKISKQLGLKIEDVIKA